MKFNLGKMALQKPMMAAPIRSFYYPDANHHHLQEEVGFCHLLLAPYYCQKNRAVRWR
jgi:hypothetical protein